MKKQKVTELYVLKNRNFLSLFSGQLIAQVGDSLNLMGILGLVFFDRGTAFSSSIFELVPLIGMAFLAIITTAPLAGLIVDKVSKKAVLISCDWIRAVIILALPAAKMLSPFWQRWVLYAVVFMLFAIGRLFYTAKSAILPSLIRKEDLLKANWLSTSAYYFGMVFGPAIGAIVVAHIGSSRAFLFNSASHFISGLLLCLIQVSGRVTIPEPARRMIRDGIVGTGVGRMKRFFAALTEGFRILRAMPEVLFAMVSLALLMSMAGSFIILLFTSAKNSFLTEKEGMEYLASVSFFLAVGVVIGASLSNIVFERFKRHHIVIIGLVLLCASSAFMATLTQWDDFAFACILFGFSAAPVFLAVETILQEEAPEHLRGRMIGGKDAVEKGALSLAAIVTVLIIFIHGEVDIKFSAMRMLMVIVSSATAVFLVMGAPMMLFKRDHNDPAG